MPDLNANDLEAAKKQVAGTARSMGIDASSERATTTEHDTRPGGPRPGAVTNEGARHGEGQEVHRRDASGSTATSCTAPPRRVDLVKSLATAKFDETVELAVRLGVDPRKADQMVRGTVALPSGTGKDVRVAVFAAGRRRRRGPRGRAPTSSAPTTSPRRSRGACSTSTSPSPRPTSCRWSAGSAGCSAPAASCRTPRPAPSPPTSARRSSEFKGGKVEYRTDRYGNVHVPIGKVSFERRRP